MKNLTFIPALFLCLLLPATTFAATAPSVAISPPTGLVSWWAGNGNSIDSVSSNNGLFTSEAYDIGFSGQAFSFSGASSVTIADTPSLHPAQFSVCLWFSWDNVGTSNIEFLLAKGGEHYEIHTGGGAGINGIRFIPAGYSSPSTSVDAPNVITAGWHHLAVTYSGSTADIYVDGVLKASRTGITGGADLSLDSTPLLMGKRSNGSYSYHGKIDDVLFFNRALTGGEITAIYSAKTAGITTTPAVLPAITAATLNGAVNDNGADTTVYFEYGADTSYGTSVAATPSSISAGSGVTTFTAGLSGLVSGTTYHFRVKAQNAAGITFGPDQSFRALIQPFMTLYTSTSTSIYGQPVTLTAFLIQSTDATGTVRFRYYNDNTSSWGVLRTEPVSLGAAGFSTSAIPAGTSYVSASYSGDGTYSSSSKTVPLTVSKAASTTTLTTNSSGTIAMGQSVTYTATVSPATATGTVDFIADDNIGTVQAVNGVATLTVSYPSVLTTNVIAIYNGDNNHESSSSSYYTLRVIPPASATRVSANMATLEFLTTSSGTGYFTLMRGSNAACGASTSVAAGQSSSGEAADYHGSLPLNSGEVEDYTVRNLQQNSAYTLCFTLKTGVALTPVLATTFTTPSAAGVGSDWLAVGEPGFSDYAAARSSLGFAPEGTPYFAYTDGFITEPIGGSFTYTGNDGRVTVRKFDGTAWVTVGSAGFAGLPVGNNAYLKAVDTLTLSFSPDGAPYVALSYTQGKDNTGSIRECKNSAGQCIDCTCEEKQDPDTCPVVACSEPPPDPPGRVTTIMRFKNSTWEAVGPYWTYGVHPSLAFAPDGTPWVAYGDDNNGGKATVKYYNGTTWVAVGAGVLSTGSAADTTLAFAPNGTPYCAYLDAAASKVTMKRFDGTNWLTVGNAGFSSGNAVNLTMALAPDGTPYVAFKDSSVSGRATVMRYGGSVWNLVGGTGFTYGAADNLALAMAPDGAPYVVFNDGSTSSKLMVLTYDGSSWANRTNSGISAEVAGNTTLAFDPNGQLHVSFSDKTNGNKTTVMKAKYFSSTTVSSTLNPALIGQTIMLSAPVQCTAWPYGGTVTFKEGETVLGTGAFNSMVIGNTLATLNITNLSAGSHTITAVYGGDGNCAASTSSALVQVVNKLPTSTSINSNHNPALIGEAITLSAPVQCTAWPYFGTVTFKEGETVLGTGEFSSMVIFHTVATLNITNLNAGSHTITAVYGGDDNCAASTSTSLVQVVTSTYQSLTASVTGSGDGTISSVPQGISPVGISCTKNGGACSTMFLETSRISVSAQPDAVSLFDRWEDACAGQPNPCKINMDSSKSVSAILTQAPLAKNSTTGATYGSLATALAAANATTPDDILLLGTVYDETVTLAAGVRLHGGWDVFYQSLTGINTTLNKGLTTTDGNSELENVDIKGSLAVHRGSLRVRNVSVK